MGKYAGSMRTRALSGAETIHVNGEVLEYLIQGNQHGYCAVHTPQCRTYGTMPCRMPYEICRTGARNMGVSCESEAKKSSCEFFRKSLFELKFLPAGMYTP